ncbi:MAG TPA: oligopeptide transporter, OPT family [Gemmatimonadales bacterium]|jgi:putative OPT family oligopeptide transporter|nr:oligopeptide transporter, OPT family [Gemmatimonadales bacterium]
MRLDTELTLRGLILGSVIAAVFTAANIYLGLRVGITIASSIPAAVISMGILRAFRTGSIRENNIVQTVASAGGTLSAIIFVLPGLIMIGWWRGFPFLTTFLICALGGILGVLFSIPLRRALVVNSPLPFPEGLAAAAVLKAGATGDEASPDAVERKRGPLIVLVGALTSATTQIISATGVAATGLAHFFRVGAGATGVQLGFSLALLGAGHLVGISVGLAMLTGLLIAWGIATPILSQGVPGDLATVAVTTWRTQVRFIGAGAIGVAAIWSLIKLVRPVFAGIMATGRARSAAGSSGQDDRDIPLSMIGLLTAGCLLLIGWLLHGFIGGTALEARTWPLLLGGVVFTVLIGGFVATVAGYMAGLIGASNSPVSGIGILATVAVALLLAVFAQPALGGGATDALVAFALFTVAIVFSIATISNDNLQDLKTGQLVGASPWKQQVALIVGVIAGSLVIPPTLDLLNRAYGFPGDPNRAAISADPLPAPQAALISTLARGVLSAQLDWKMIGIGALVGLVCIVLDELLGALKLIRLSPLAIGIGIYLPMDATQPVVVGALIGWLYNRAMDRRGNAEMAKRFGVLLASGLIVGESLLGVLNAGLIVATGSAAPLALVGVDFAGPAQWVGIVLFALVIAWSYRWVSRQSELGPVA